MAKNDDNEAKRKAEEIRRALLPEKHTDAGERLKRDFRECMGARNRVRFEELLRGKGYSGVELEVLLRQFDEYQRKA